MLTHVFEKKKLYCTAPHSVVSSDSMLTLTVVETESLAVGANKATNVELLSGMVR